MDEDVRLGTTETDTAADIHRDMQNDLESCMTELQELKELYTSVSEELLRVKQEIDEKTVELRLKKSELKKHKDKLAILGTHLDTADSELEEAESTYRHMNNAEIKPGDAGMPDQDTLEVMQYFEENGKSLPFMSLIDRFGSERIQELLQSGILVKAGKNIYLSERGRIN